MRTKFIVALFLLFLPSIALGDTATNLVAWWRYLASSGTSAVDSSPGAPYTTTLVNSVAWAAGPYARLKALDFDGTDDYGYSTAGAVLRNGVSNNLTFATWLWIDASGRNDVFNWKSSDGTDEIGFFVNASSKLEGYVVIDSVGGSTVVGATTVNTSTWYHIALTKNGNTWTVYLNHVSDGTGSATVTLANHGSSTFWIGSNHDSSFLPLASFNLDGKMADTRIYNRALSVSDITELHNYRGPAVAPITIFSMLNQPTPLTFNKMLQVQR
jgi:hypothetical protein